MKNILIALSLLVSVSIPSAQANPDLFRELRKYVKGKVITHPKTLKSKYASDFGRTSSFMPIAAIQVETVSDVRNAIQLGNKYQTRVVPRGAAHNTEGQSQSDSGIILDMRKLNYIEHPQADGTVRVQAGALWVDVMGKVQFAREGDDLSSSNFGRVPSVLTSHWWTTVGGTLSVGGIGTDSIALGFQVDHVRELKVVTGQGGVFDCSRTFNSELFYGVLGSHGQLGVIVEAVLELRETRDIQLNFMTIDLAYENLGTLLTDLKNPGFTNRFDGADSGIFWSGKDWIYRAIYRKYKYPKNESRLPRELEKDNDKWRDYLLNGPSGTAPENQAHHQTLLETKTPQLDLILMRERMAGRSTFQMGLEQIGKWDIPHPWFDIFIPGSQIEAFVAEALKIVDPAILGGIGAIQVHPIRRPVSTWSHVSLLQTPREELFFNFGVLSFPDTDALVAQAKEINVKLAELALKYGGKSYLIDGLPQTNAEWREHMGEEYEPFLALKKKHDPNQVLTKKGSALSTLFE